MLGVIGLFATQAIKQRNTITQGNRSNGTALQGNRSNGTALQGNRSNGTALQGNRSNGTPLQGNRSNGTPLQGNRPLQVNNGLHDTTSIPHVDNDLVTGSTSIGAPLTTAADTYLPSYSEVCCPPMAEELTTDISPPPYPVPSSPPPAYPASGYASV